MNNKLFNNRNLRIKSNQMRKRQWSVVIARLRKVRTYLVRMNNMNRKAMFKAQFKKIQTLSLSKVRLNILNNKHQTSNHLLSVDKMSYRIKKYLRIKKTIKYRLKNKPLHKKNKVNRETRRISRRTSRTETTSITL